MDARLEAIDIGNQVYADESTENFGAVRAVAPGARDEIVIYIENGGEFVVPLHAIRSAHDGKVILDSARLEKRLLDSIAHAHDREVPGL